MKLDSPIAGALGALAAFTLLMALVAVLVNKWEPFLGSLVIWVGLGGAVLGVKIHNRFRGEEE